MGKSKGGHSGKVRGLTGKFKKRTVKVGKGGGRAGILTHTSTVILRRLFTIIIDELGFFVWTTLRISFHWNVSYVFLL